jgi:hypothetical protein
MRAAIYATKHNVGRLDVAMNNMISVRVSERVGYLAEQLKGERFGHSTLLSQKIRQRDAIDEIHDQIWRPVIQAAKIDDAANVLMA